MTKLRILSSSGKRAMGLEGFSMILADEPGSWEKKGRLAHVRRLAHRTREAGRKARAAPHNDRHSRAGRVGMVDPSDRRRLRAIGYVHVTELRVPACDPWHDYQMIARVNPLIRVSASLRRAILRERDAARSNPTARASFKAYRLNMKDIGTAADSLVSLDDWKRVEDRPVLPRAGRPVVGLDIGGNRSWSAAWCLWSNGRSEAYAVVPGIPSLEARERQDAQPRGLYQALEDDGVLVIDPGVRVSSPAVLVDHLVRQGIRPQGMICDRFLVESVADAVRGRWPILKRVTRWSEATEDVPAFSKLVHGRPALHRPRGAQPGGRLRSPEPSSRPMTSKAPPASSRRTRLSGSVTT